MPEEEEAKVVLERVYTIPLRRVYEAPRTKRAPRAVRLVKKFLLRHMKTKEVRAETVKLDPALNEIIWARGIEKPPRKVKVRAVLYDDGTVKVFPAE